MSFSRIVSAFVAVAAITSACSTRFEPEKPALPSSAAAYPMLNYSFIWHDTPGTDLFSADGTFIRAAIESFYRGIDGSGVEEGFPGYLTAVSGAPYANHSLDIAAQHVRDPSELAGALHARILRSVEASDSVEVDTCVYRDVRFQTDSFDSTRYATSLLVIPIDAGRLRYRRIGVPPPLGQFGRANRPVVSPFGDWRIDYFSVVGADRPYDEVKSQEADCEAARGDIPTADDVPGTIPKSEVPRVMPFPGWPEASP